MHPRRGHPAWPSAARHSPARDCPVSIGARCVADGRSDMTRLLKSLRKTHASRLRMPHAIAALLAVIFTSMHVFTGAGGISRPHRVPHQSSIPRPARSTWWMITSVARSQTPTAGSRTSTRRKRPPGSLRRTKSPSPTSTSFPTGMRSANGSPNSGTSGARRSRSSKLDRSGLRRTAGCSGSRPCTVNPGSTRSLNSSSIPTCCPRTAPSRWDSGHLRLTVAF